MTLLFELGNLGTISRPNQNSAPVINVLRQITVADIPVDAIATDWDYRFTYFVDYPDGIPKYYGGPLQGGAASDYNYSGNSYPFAGFDYSLVPDFTSIIPPSDNLIFTGSTIRTIQYDNTSLYPNSYNNAFTEIIYSVLTSVRIFGYYPSLPIDRPSYYSLLDGYSLDTRIVPSYPIVTPSETKTINLKYYKNNKLEATPNLKSICWMAYKVNLTKDIPFKLPIFDCVLGTLYSDYSNLAALLSTADNLTTDYPFNSLLPSAINGLFSEWMTLYNNTINPNNPAILWGEERLLCKLAANNNVWNNANLSANTDILPRSGNTHPMFNISDSLAYYRHIQSQPNGSMGNLIMDSPRTIEIHAALDASKWGVNPDDPDVARIDNLGWRIERGNQVLGIRVKPDGTIDEELEKTTNRRLHVEGSEPNDVQDYNPNCFGKEGMLVRHLPNKFSSSGTVAGGYRKIKDIPQYLAEMHEQANAAMGYQEGTAIEIQLDGETYRYANQLALMTEIFVTMKQSATYSKGAFFSSLIAEQTIKEVMGGLGLRTVDRFLEFKVAGKVVKLYYKGISASQSIRRKLSAVSTNIGMVIGNII